VGVDGSKESLEAALLAANLAHQTHRSIQLAHVLPDAIPMPPEAFSTELAIWRKGIAEEGTKLLRDLGGRVDRADTEARSTPLESARPADALAELAKEPDVDLLVVR
jgi:nucleotide-binding universal stress UspA family protein